MKNAREHYLIFALLLSLFVLPSCRETTALPGPFCLTGNASGCVSSRIVDSLNELDLPQGFSLYIQIDSVCAEKEYYRILPQIDSAIVIVATLKPRLIKAEVYGLGSNVLSSYKSTDYFNTQQNYASGGSLEKALLDMTTVCSLAYEDAQQKTNWFRKRFSGPITDTLSDLMQVILQFIVPRNGFIGKIIQPVYSLSYWAISISGSVTFGLMLIAFLFASIILILFFCWFIILKKGKRGLLLVISASILLWIMFLFVVYYSFRIGKPIQENIFAYENIYNYKDTSPLVNAYLSHSFHPTSFILLLLTSIAFFTMKILKLHSEYKSAELQGIADEYAQKKGEDLAEDFSNDPLGPVKNTLLVLAVFIFVDRSIVIGFLFYFILRIIMLSSNYKTIALFYANHAKTIIFSIVITFSVLLGTAYAHGRTVRNQYQYFNNESIDSVSYYLGVNLGYWFNKVGVNSIDKIDTVQVISGIRDYLSSRTCSTHLTGKIYTDNNIFKTNSFPKGEQLDKVSYTIGRSYARTVFNWGIFPLLNYERLSTGLCDCILRRSAQYPIAIMEKVLDNHVLQYRSHLNSYNMKNGALFLSNNSRNENVVYNPSGLQYQIINQGNSKRATPKERVYVKYIGYTMGGDIFDSSTRPKSFVLNRTIAGFEEAVEQIGEGGKIIAWVPSSLGYNDKGNNSAGIMPGEIIVFEIELIAIY